MRVLGVSLGHDRSAALVESGRIVAAIAQERLDRVKYSEGYHVPVEAVFYALGAGDLAPRDIDLVTVSSAELTEAELLAAAVPQMLELGFKAPVKHVSHHLAHAASAFFTSPFENALIWVADGGGQILGGRQEAESLFIGSGQSVHLLRTRLADLPSTDITSRPFGARESTQVSLGRKYEQFTYLLGFDFGECGKTMGLAAYGATPQIALRLSEENHYFDLNLRYCDYLQDFLSDHTGEISFSKAAEIAALAQHLLEEHVISILHGALAETGQKHLCISGGVALNCTLNGRLARELQIDKLYAFPAAGDDGQSVGSALLACHQVANCERHELRSPFLGSNYTEVEMETAIRDADLRFSRPTELSLLVSERLAQGQVVGWFQDSSEFGPRALGHRSILADPSPSAMQHHLNSKVKRRETFRPFAPIVTAGTLQKYFDVPTAALPCTPFMLATGRVLNHYRDQLPAITHVDGSARVQSISLEENPMVYSVLECFQRLRGYPILVNTSFNVASEPLVESPSDAIKTFLRSNLDALTVGPFLVERPDS